MISRQVGVCLFSFFSLYFSFFLVFLFSSFPLLSLFSFFSPISSLSHDLGQHLLSRPGKFLQLKKKKKNTLCNNSNGKSTKIAAKRAKLSKMCHVTLVNHMMPQIYIMSKIKMITRNAGVFSSSLLLSSSILTVAVKVSSLLFFQQYRLYKEKVYENSKLGIFEIFPNSNQSNLYLNYFE